MKRGRSSYEETTFDSKLESRVPLKKQKVYQTDLLTRLYQTDVGRIVSSCLGGDVDAFLLFSPVNKALRECTRSQVYDLERNKCILPTTKTLQSFYNLRRIYIKEMVILGTRRKVVFTNKKLRHISLSANISRSTRTTPLELYFEAPLLSLHIYVNQYSWIKPIPHQDVMESLKTVTIGPIHVTSFTNNGNWRFPKVSCLSLFAPNMNNQENLFCVDNCLAPFPNITQLSLSKSVYFASPRIPMLRLLSLCAEMKQLPSSLDAFHSLQTLELLNVDEPEQVEQVSKLSNLTSLTLRQMDLSKFTPSLSWLPKLRTLTLQVECCKEIEVPPIQTLEEIVLETWNDTKVFIQAPNLRKASFTRLERKEYAVTPCSIILEHVHELHITNWTCSTIQILQPESVHSITFNGVIQEHPYLLSPHFTESKRSKLLAEIKQLSKYSDKHSKQVCYSISKKLGELNNPSRYDKIGTFECSGYPSLRHLTIQKSYFHSLRLSNLPSLAQFRFTENECRKFEFTKCPRLKSGIFHGSLCEIFYCKELPVLEIYDFRHANIKSIEFGENMHRNRKIIRS